MKLALCIGINAYGGTNSLNGCVNDANDLAFHLRQRGFKTTMLLDQAASYDGIVAAMRKIVAQAQPGDDVIVSFSGHGTFDPDANGDEGDKKDEAICPCPVNGWWQMLYDDEIGAIFDQRQPGVRFVFISDSCHSGTVNRISRQSFGDRKARFVHMDDLRNKLKRTRIKRRASRNTGDVLLLSGCEDHEFSYETEINGRLNGMLTRTAINVLKWVKPTTYRQWHAEIIKRIPKEYPQHPQLRATEEQANYPTP